MITFGRRATRLATMGCALTLLIGATEASQSRSSRTFASPRAAVAAASDKTGDTIDPLLDDPSIPRNWGLDDIETASAWRLTRGHRDIIVAVIDTGADTRHPALKDNLWINRGEAGQDESGRDRAHNGIDDDHNGFVDDVHGWNFAADSADVQDHHGHGSHIAGIVKGVAPRVSLMILKYYDPRISGVNTVATTVKALRYAVKMRAHVINYSGGGRESSPLEREAIAQASRHGILVVAAAGNERSNSDFAPYYPADYPLENILSVTAIDPNGKILPSSNFGARSVDIAAPGSDIYSALPGGRYGPMTGTSQATAFATGVAALLRAHNPDLQEPEQIIRHLVRTGTHEMALAGKTRARTILNSYRALAMQERGVAASGAIARNTKEIDASVFTVEPESHTPHEARTAAAAPSR